MPRKFFLSNLQFKVMLLFLLTALVPLGIVSAFSNKTAEELIMNTVYNHMENVADDKTALLERWISERKSDLEVIAGSSILKSMSPELISPYLQLVGKTYKAYRGFTVVAADGAVIFDDFPGPSDQREDWYRQSLAGRLHISDIALGPVPNESTFRISAPISDPVARVQGAVCATVGTAAIQSMILKVSLGKTGECYLVDKEGTFLAHKDPKRILISNIAQSESFKNIFGSVSHRRTYTDYRGIKVLGVSRKIAGADWYLVVEQDRDEAFIAADRLQRYILLVTIFSVLGAIILAWLLSYSVVRPILSLSTSAGALARGDFEQAVAGGTDRADEIGLLHNAFADMAKQLQARQYNLEKKVNLTEAELKQTDARLKLTEMAAARSEQLAALGRLAAGVTHEIRTPLASLKLFLESVKAEFEISPDYQEDYRVAMNQVRRMEATINRFLDFAKPQEPILTMVELEKLIEEALLVVKPRANQQEILVNISLDHPLPQIRGDKKQLGEALVNLIVNAFEAMPSGGALSISASNGQYEVNHCLRQCVRIEVADTGAGIEAKNLERLFDPFFTTKSSGTGLGLSIVRSTVRAHQGEIRVESRIGKGTAFSLFLPVSA